MKILLDNHNEQVASVVNICCERIGADLVEYSADENEYDLAIKNYEEGDEISNFDLCKTLFLTPKNVSLSGVRYTLIKPFSPLELITFISEFSVQTMSAQAKEKMAKEFADASSVMKEIDAIDKANEETADGASGENTAASSQNFEALVDDFYNSSDDVPLSQLAQEFDAELNDDVPLNTLVQDVDDDVPLSAVAQGLADDIPLSAVADELADKIPDDIPLNAALENISDDTPLSLAADAIADDVPLNLAAREIANAVPLDEHGAAADDGLKDISNSAAETDSAPESAELKVDVPTDDAQNEKNVVQSENAEDLSPKEETPAEFIPLAPSDDMQAPIALAGDDLSSVREQNLNGAREAAQSEDLRTPLSSQNAQSDFKNFNDEISAENSKAVQQSFEQPQNSKNLQSRADTAGSDFDAAFSKIFDRISEADYFGSSTSDFETDTEKTSAKFTADIAAKSTASVAMSSATGARAGLAAGASTLCGADVGAGSASVQATTDPESSSGAVFVKKASSYATSAGAQKSLDAPIALAGEGDLSFESLYNEFPFESVQTDEPYADESKEQEPTPAEGAKQRGDDFDDRLFSGGSSDFSSHGASAPESKSLASGAKNINDTLMAKIGSAYLGGVGGFAVDGMRSARNFSEQAALNACEQKSEEASSDELNLPRAVNTPTASNSGEATKSAVRGEQVRGERGFKKPSAEELKSKLRDDLEAGIANTIEKFAGSKDAKDALKDFKINIDISFGDR